MNKGSRYIHTVTCLAVFLRVAPSEQLWRRRAFRGTLLKIYSAPTRLLYTAWAFRCCGSGGGTPSNIFFFLILLLFSRLHFCFSGRCRRFIPATVPFGFIPGDPVSCAPLTPSPFQGAAIMFPFLFWSILEPRLSHPPVAFRLRPVVLVLVSRQYCLMAPRTLPA